MTTTLLSNCDLKSKVDNLQSIFSDMGSVLVAFSGGVDSSLLLKMAYEVLKDKVLAVTASSIIRAPYEIERALIFTEKLGVKHLIVRSNELSIPEVANNDFNRCYFCKRELFINLQRIAEKNDMNYVIEASNLDDEDTYRPGMRALQELNIRSPLREVGLGKQEIRLLARELNLPAWNQPSNSCYLTRFPYNHRISIEQIRQVSDAESILESLGFQQKRVRIYGDLVRIEVEKEKILKAILPEVSALIVQRFKELGYRYVTIDLEGYRSGSMDE